MRRGSGLRTKSADVLKPLLINVDVSHSVVIFSLSSSHTLLEGSLLWILQRPCCGEVGSVYTSC